MIVYILFSIKKVYNSIDYWLNFTIVKEWLVKFLIKL